VAREGRHMMEMTNEEIHKLIKDYSPKDIDYKIISNQFGDIVIELVSNVKTTIHISEKDLKAYPQNITSAGLQIKRFYEQDAKENLHKMCRHFSAILFNSSPGTNGLFEPLAVNQNATPYAGGDFYYDLFEGGYIKPQELLSAGSTKVLYALDTIKEFKNLLEESGLIKES
jgi:hypothetical protein